MATSAFLANLSHEVHTPLNAIADTYRLKRSGVVPDQATRLDRLEVAGKHLLEIVDAVLDLSRIEAHRLVLEKVPAAIEDIVANVTALLAPAAQAESLQLVTQCPATRTPLPGDPTRLQPMLLNFAANAVKFTAAGSVTLRAQVDETAAADRPRRGPAGGPRAAAPGGDRHRHWHWHWHWHRHRHWHRRRPVEPPVQALRAGRQLDHAAVRRQPTEA